MELWWFLCYLTEQTIALQWRHNDRDCVSNHQPCECLLKRLFRRRSKKTSKLPVTGLGEGNSPVTGEFPAQRDSNAENVSIWWSHHEKDHPICRWFALPWRSFVGNVMNDYVLSTEGKWARFIECTVTWMHERQMICFHFEISIHIKKVAKLLLWLLSYSFEFLWWSNPVLTTSLFCSIDVVVGLNNHLSKHKISHWNLLHDCPSDIHYESYSFTEVSLTITESNYSDVIFHGVLLFSHVQTSEVI